MNAKELADLLDGSEYGTDVLVNTAKENNLVIVYGASDDLMEFKGTINEELGACDGTKVKLNANGLLLNECDSDSCPYFAQLMVESTLFIEALWCNDDIDWTYKTNIPHETFNIMEDGEIYCTGIVFSLKDLKA
jgi:hypothetical protein